ncbi:hypothetical protein [Gelria sp. Kuro-4]|uniref:hypothetical protein n=1 Tax=Gelria sp. Kuro-4 TaxID=2796927 RepID=UPI001BEE0620|nr:hypothetical protein [Gelria sp. Kuro-4]BCV23303.1 hypothetical protein kuro4_00760 [Gelria sp. Kuro-4]
MVDYFKLAQDLTQASGGVDYFKLAQEMAGRTKVAAPKKTPYEAAQTEIGHNIARLQAVGAPVPNPPTHPNFLTRVFDILDRPGAAVRGAVKAILSPESESVLGEAWKGLTGQAKVSGADVLKEAGIEPKNKVLNWLTSLATEIVLDPTTYLTLGATTLAKKAGQESAEQIAKRIIPEIAKETGKTISESSAKLLAENALKGQIPIGKLGAAVQRALGFAVEKTALPAGLRPLEQALALREAGALTGITYPSAKAAVRALESRIAKGQLPDIARGILERLTKEGAERSAYKVVGEVPRYTAEFGSIMGFTKPVASVDITRLVNSLRSGAARVAGKPGEAVADFLGRAFIRDYTPQAFKGVERAGIVQAKKAIAKAETEAPAAAGVTLQRTLADWQRKGLPQTARESASYVLEEGMTKPARLLRVTQDKINRTMDEIVHLAQQDVIPQKEFAKKWKQIDKLRTTLQNAQAELTAQRERLFGALGITKDTKTASRIANQLYRRDLELLQQEHVPINVVQFYTSHIFKDPPEKVKAVLEKYAASKGISAAHPFFLKHRAFKNLTIEDLEALGLHPVKDVAVQTAIHRALTDQLLTINKMGRELRALGPDVIRPAKAAPPGWFVIRDTTVPSLKDMAVHPEVATSLQRLYNVVRTPDVTSKAFEDAYSRAMRNLKALMTAWNPRFHIVNGIGGAFFNFIDGVPPKTYDEARRLFQGTAKEAVIQGKRISRQTLLDLFNRHGLAGQGAFRQAATTRSLLEEATQTAAKIGLSAEGAPTAWQRFTGVPRAVGEATDTYMRFTNFLAQLKRGLSPDAAAAHVKAIHYDYGALTPFEQKLSHYLIPFYAWVRFNTPAMLKLLATRPGIYMAARHTVETAKEAQGIKDEDVPTWLRDLMAVPIGKDARGNYIFFNPSLPITDLARIPDFGDPGSGMRELGGLINPVLTMIPQLATNRSMFYGGPISRYEAVPMERLKDSINFALSQIGPAREIMAARRYAKETPEKPLTTKRIPGLGSLITTVNPQGMQQGRTFEYRDLLRQWIELQKARGLPVPDWNELKKAQGQR